ncbi:MAG: hypothetical protein LBP61_08535 [Desulfovibrio sp.]|jgi:hypothetical protein|nr:hypothetical protein [Desulfovibrio sp.]
MIHATSAAAGQIEKTQPATPPGGVPDRSRSGPCAGNCPSSHEVPKTAPVRGNGKTGLLSLFLLCCLLILPACGKKGPPEPRDSSRTFRWAEVQAEMTGPCLGFSGSLEGAYGNLDGIRIELSPVNGPDDCPGCPFVPREIALFSPSDAGFDPRSGEIAFAYCPVPAMAYRWRLIGISVYTSLPHAVSAVKMTGNMR